MIKDIRHFIDKELDTLLKDNSRDYDKLMEKILRTRLNIFAYLSELSNPIIPITCQEDNVNHPSHYTSHPSGTECIEIARHYCFSIGNAIKYLWRAGLKKEAGLKDVEKEIEDLKKARWYIDDRIKQLQTKLVN